MLKVRGEGGGELNTKARGPGPVKCGCYYCPITLIVLMHYTSINIECMARQHYSPDATHVCNDLSSQLPFTYSVRVRVETLIYYNLLE